MTEYREIQKDIKDHHNKCLMYFHYDGKLGQDADDDWWWWKDMVKGQVVVSRCDASGMNGIGK